MNLALALGRIHIPAFIKKSQLRKLFICTAAAFQRPVPPMGSSFAGALRTYALFTRDLMKESFRLGEDEPEIQARLYRNAYGLGRELRKTLRPATPDEVRRAMSLLYRAMGIKAAFDAEGNATVRACYFSPYYTSRNCQLMSALDAGLAAGLSGGGRLVFSQRMTEGHEHCLARLEL